MKENKKVYTAASGKKKIVVVLLVVTILLLVGILAYAFIWNRDEADNPKEQASTGLGYESSAVVVTDEKTLQEMVDDMMASNGQTALQYSPSATSSDGKNFVCNIANSPKNTYDMYLGIYLDDDLTDEIYLTQLIRPGEGIKSFTASRKLEAGTYSCILVFTKVDEDHQSILSQIRVVYTLNVN